MFLLLLLQQPTSISPHRWTPANVVAGSSAAVSLMIDWAQTRQAMRQGWEEKNPLLGDHPSSRALTTYNLLVLPTVAGVGAALPSRWRTWWYVFVTAVEAASITGNARLGLHVGF